MRKLVLLALTLAACGPPSADETEDGAFYQGKVLEVIVPFGPGGGGDTWARIVVPHLQQRLGERSAIQILNLPGGSSLAGANEFAVRRPHDGRSALVSTASTFIAALLGEPMVRYDFAEFAPIISSPGGGVVYISSRLGIDSASELPQLRSQLTYGGITPAGLDLVPLLAFELLGMDVHAILGYSDRGAARLAFEQGETDIDYQTIPAYVASVEPLIRSDVAVPLFSFGITTEEGELVRDPAVPDLPSVRDVHVELYGREPEGVAWEAYKALNAVGISTAKVLWLHGDAPPAAIQALREAAEQISNDPEFLARARLEVGDYPFYVGTEVNQAMNAAAAIAPETVTWLRELLSSRYGLARLDGSP